MIKSKKLTVQVGTLAILVALIYAAYYLLLNDGSMSSITSIVAYSNKLTLKQHILVLALLPIYIGSLIFGTVMLGFYLAACFEFFYLRTLKHK